MPPVTPTLRAAALLCSLGITLPALAGRPGEVADPAKRDGDEIVVGGVYIHTGTPVVLWTDPDGMSLTGLSRGTIRKPVGTTAPAEAASSPSDAEHAATTTPATGPTLQAEGEPNTRVVRGPNVPLDVLRENVDQLVMHFDACGVSQECFAVLKKRRLSVQFMCDLDGTIYQAMDAGEASQHATKANTRSIGVEIANIGTFSAEGPIPASVREWYRAENGGVRITIPEKFGPEPLRKKGFIARPAKFEPVAGVIQGKGSRQYDFTREQYRALAQLSATLCMVLPKIQPDFPRQRVGAGRLTPELLVDAPAGEPTTRPDAIAQPEQAGPLIPHALTDAQYDTFQGIVGHYHVQTNKNDPGPAFQWFPLLNEIKRLMTPEAKAACVAARGRPVNNGMLPPLPAE